MTPGQARVALLGFFALAGGVAFNALVLQERPQSAARTAADQPPPRPGADRARKSGEAAKGGRSSQQVPAAAADDGPRLRIARFAPDSARLDLLPETFGTAEAGAETVRGIQRELKQRGYGPLTIDGVVGLGTRAAIMAFEHDHRLPITAEASEALLKRILLGVSAGDGAPGAGKVRTGEAEEIVRDVQKRLAALGYRIGATDGRLGEETIKGIRDFEADKGMVPRGRVSAEIIQRLEAAAAAARSGSR